MGIFRQFPYSNFHEMNMDEIIKMVRELADDWAEYQLKWNNLYEDTEQALVDFKAYVEQYWDSLDLTSEVNTVLHQMLLAGELDSIFLNQLSPVVTNWLNTHITVPEGVVIDSSLSIEGACADAKATGDALRTMNRNIHGLVFGDNLAIVDAPNKTTNGITFVTSASSVVAGGTATGNAFIDFFTFKCEKSGKYHLKGAPTGGGAGAFIMYVQGIDSYDIGEGCDVNLVAGTTYTLRIVIYTGYTASNLIFTPVLQYVFNTSFYTDRVNGVERSNEIENFEFEWGSWAQSGKNYARNRARTQLIKASGTFTISMENMPNVRFSVVQYPLDETASFIDSGWKTTEYTVNVDPGHCFCLNLSKTDNSNIDDLTIFKPTITSTDGFMWHLATAEDIENLAKSRKWLELDQYYYAHLFLNSQTDDIIPSQSLYDINASARLGFKMIEANVKKLSDGNYLTCHGGGAGGMYFGSQFEHVDGQTDITNIAFASVTLDWVRTNVRYKTDYSKYKTYPPTLQEFLYECKKYDMTALIQCIDANVAEIADNILGKYKWIAYNAASRDITDGMIVLYEGAQTKQGILNVCYKFGAPFMYCMSNPTFYSFDELKDIIIEVHKIGCLIGYAGLYLNEAYNQRYKELGFDFCASGWSVNNFDSGNICNLSGELTFEDFHTNGTIVNNTIELNSGQSVTPNMNFNNVFLGKGELIIVFEGNITIDTGRIIQNYQFDSTATPSVCVSTIYLNEIPTFEITSNGNSKIKSITYRLSKC